MKVMMKVSMLLLTAVLMIALLVACGNRQMIDTTYTYDHAIISLPDGRVVDGEIQSWRDYEDGDQIQVVVDGNTYLVHSSNIALIND